MKKCGYCGRENDEDAAYCFECGTEFASISAPPLSTGPEPTRPRYHIPPLSPQEGKLDLVTIVNCQTLFEADVVVSELEAAGIHAVIPDEFVFNLNVVGYVRVQVAPQDYEAAKDVIEDSERRAARPSAPE